MNGASAANNYAALPAECLIVRVNFSRNPNFINCHMCKFGPWNSNAVWVIRRRWYFFENFHGCKLQSSSQWKPSASFECETLMPFSSWRTNKSALLIKRSKIIIEVAPLSAARVHRCSMAASEMVLWFRASSRSCSAVFMVCELLYCNIKPNINTKISFNTF